MKSLLVRRSQVVGIVLSCLQPTYFSLLWWERDLWSFAQVLEISVLRFYRNIVWWWHNVSRCRPETIGWWLTEFVRWFFNSPWGVHAKWHARLPHPIGISTHIELLNWSILWESSFVERAWELVDPDFLLSVFSTWDALGNSKVLFFDFVLILFQVGFGVGSNLFIERSSLVPLLFVARTIVIRIKTIIEVLIKY